MFQKLKIMKKCSKCGMILRVNCIFQNWITLSKEQKGDFTKLLWLILLKKLKLKYYSYSFIALSIKLLFLSSIVTNSPTKYIVYLEKILIITFISVIYSVNIEFALIITYLFFILLAFRVYIANCYHYIMYLKLIAL